MRFLLSVEMTSMERLEGYGNVGAKRPHSHTPFTARGFVISTGKTQHSKFCREKSIVLSQIIS